MGTDRSRRRAGLAIALLQALTLPLLALGLWQWLSQRSAGFEYAFVPLPQVARSFVELARSGELAINIGASLVTTLKGLALGSMVGIAIGIATASLRPVDVLLTPLIQALRQVPTLALIPLLGLWFGNSEFSKLLLVSMAVFEVMALNTYEGLKRVDPQQLDVARVLLLGRMQVLRRILLPAALPAIATGVQQAIAFAWLATVGAELLFTVGAGISSVMERAQSGGRMDVVVVCLVFVATLGYLMQEAWRLASRRLLRWRKTGYAR